MVEEWAFYLAKDLLYNHGEVGEPETALRAVGIDANDHTTRPFHCGGCDGMGGANCEEREAEMAAQRFKERKSDRHERRERSRRDAHIASGAFTVGQPVLAHYDSRAAVVMKINRVTVKVKHVGDQADSYQPVERNYSPTYLHPLPAKLTETAAAIAVGHKVQFLDRGRRSRIGEVLETDGPLLRVGYPLASGRDRTAWIDVLHLDGDGGLPC